MIAVRERLRRFAALTVLLSFVLFVQSRPAVSQEPASEREVFAGLKYRLIGPAAGGRACRVAGIPGDPLTYYVATASGGVWKSADGGIKWEPIFDDQPTSTAGSIVVSVSDPNVVYVGSGEANIRGNVTPGNGIYKSIDAGKTWNHVLKLEGQIGTIIVHPKNPDNCFAAVLGNVFGSSPDRGVYRTRDGGKTWEKVLFKDIDTGCSDVCFDLNNPNILFAGFWQTRRKPWNLTSGGPGGSLYMSRDGGDSWEQLGPTPLESPLAKGGAGNGLPPGPYGKVGVAVAPSDSRRVYALIEAEKGGLYRSDDGGENWRRTSDNGDIRIRAWYYTTVHVDPTNADVVWCPNIPMMRSIDGGKTFQRFASGHHGDYHDIWIDPTNPKRMINANDGGVDVTINGGETWYAPPLPITQFYHINVDNRTPYFVSGTMQDLGCEAGPSNSLNYGGISRQDWYGVGGGETGFTMHDPTDPNIVYATEYGGYISRYDHRTRQASNISIYPVNAVGKSAEDVKYRFRWPAPILLSPHDSNVLYHGGNVLFKTTDGGKNWTAISDDLTRNDKSKQGWSGGPITGDNTTAEFYCTIASLAESPLQKDLLWVGTDDAQVHITRDGGKTWENIAGNISGLPEWAAIKCIEPSKFDPGTATIAVDAHMLNDMRPHVYQTSDFGKSWKSLTPGMPTDQGYVHVVREDPKRKGFLYAGNEMGVIYSTDTGATWKSLRLNMPPAAVHDMVVKDDDLVVGTNGRSIFILDDLTPIREMSPKVAESEVHLFPPATTYRYSYRFERSGAGAGQNPPAGALIHYYLKKQPKEAVKLEVLDEAGTVVSTLETKPDSEDDEDDPFSRFFGRSQLSTEPGVQRIVWNFRYKGAEPIKGAKMRGGVSAGPSAIPGTYTVKLTVGDKTVTQPLVLKPDPRVSLADEEYAEQLRFALTVRGDINKMSSLVDQMRAVKQQLKLRSQLLKDDSNAAEFIKHAKAFVAEIEVLEDKLYLVKAKVPNDQLAIKGGGRLYADYAHLFRNASRSDAAPTQGMREVYAELAAQLQQYDGEWKELVSGDLTTVNDLAKKLEKPHVIVPTPAKDG